jgi:DNA modification methylase/ParB-like chromosome segregation protein Spo0J
MKPPVKFPIDKILIRDRARKDLGDMEALQKSISERGLINAIVVNKKDLFLVAGYRRLTCCRALGMKEIDVRFTEDLSDLDKTILELEENLHEALKWYEQAKLRDKIHRLYQEEHGKATKGHGGGWGLEDTAKTLGVSAATLSQDMVLVETAKIAPDIMKFVSRKQALKSIDKVKEYAILTRLSQMESEESEGVIPRGDRPYTILNGEAVEIIKTNISNEVIDMVIFDPPWGVDADILATSRGNSGEKTFYDDSEAGSRRLCKQLLPELYRVMKDGSHMYMFVGAQYMNMWQDVLMNQRRIPQPDWTLKYEVLEENRAWAFDVRHLPIIWVKEGGGFTDFDYKFMPRYEMILFCVKGVRRLNFPISDVLDYRRPLTTERIHPQQKSAELIRDFIKVSTHEGALVLDPTMGSGVTVVEAVKAGRRALGIEKDQEAFLKAQNWIQGMTVDNDEKGE